MDTIVGYLQDFGLSLKEAKVYYVLLRLGLGTSEEIKRESGLNRLQTYRTLSSLINRGLVEINLDRPRKYIPLEMERAVDLLKQEAKIKLQELEKKETLLLNGWNESPDLKHSMRKYTLRIIQGNKNVFRFGIKLYENAKTTIDIIAKGGGLMKAVTFGIDDVLEKCVKRNVTIRRISEVDFWNMKAANRLMELGEFRHLPLPNFAQLAIIDDVEVLVGFSNDGCEPELYDENAIWTNQPELVSTFRVCFDLAWNISKDGGFMLKTIDSESYLKQEKLKVVAPQILGFD